jgi:hypothetical protein
VHLSGFDRFAWAAGFVGEILLLIVLFVRRRTASLPVFTTYIAFQVVRSAVLFFIFYHCPFSGYQHWYWKMGFLEEAIELGVIYEIAVHVFCPTGVWARDVRATFVNLVGGGTAVALVLALVAQPAAPHPIQTFILRSDLFASVLMSELFVGMMVLSRTAGLPWKTHTARIAQAFGTLSIVWVILNTISNFVGLSREHHTYTQLSRISAAAYLACEVYWIVMLWAEAPAPQELSETVRIQIYTLQRQVENDLIRIRSWRNN